MFKKIVSMLAALSIISSIPPALAENTDASDIVSAEYFTEDNVIYNALQCADGGAALYSGDSADESEGITADFDVVLGLDMSSAMYGFDYNGEMEWLDDFRSLSEQVPDGTRFSVVTSEAAEFSTDLDAQLDKLTGKTYSGESDIVTLLDECLNTFDSTDRNNVIIATAAKVSDAAALSDKMDELRDYGVVPFVFVLNQEENTALDDIEDVYDCTSNLELRLAISDLYLSFAEFDNAAVMTTSDTNAVANVSNQQYVGDFKDRYFMDMDTDAGSALASVMNMYSTLPLKAFTDESVYDLTNNGVESIENIIDFLKGNGTALDCDKQITNAASLWSGIYDDCAYSDNISDILEKNLKRRFPVIVQIGSKSDDIYGIVNVYSVNEEGGGCGQILGLRKG